MKKLIGYQIILTRDNGDNFEWWRETNYVSPIYASKDLAEDSLEMLEKKISDDVYKQCGERPEFDTIDIKEVYVYQEASDEYKEFNIAD